MVFETVKCEITKQSDCEEISVSPELLTPLLNPQADHLSKDLVVVKGCNGQPPCDTPNLVMSWCDQDEVYSSFKCIARGRDSHGKPITVSSAVKPEQENSSCSESKDPIYCELQKMSSKLEVITDTSGKLSIQVEALDAKYNLLEKGFEGLGRKFESLKEGVDAKYDSVQDSVDSINGKYDSLKKDVDGKHDSFQDSVDTINGKYDSLQDSVDSVNGKYDSLQDSVDSVNGKYDSLQDSVDSVNGKYDSLQDSVDSVNGKYGLLMGVESKYASLQKSIDTVIGKFDSLKRIALISTARFDVSDVYNERVYLVTKAAEDFNLGSANKVCRKSGGYLVELDDTEEYQFVYDLVSKIGGASDFFTGGNDVNREGYFVYYNSGKPVPKLTWKRGQPDNTQGKEHCMEFSLFYGALNDCPCYAKGKYVCEVPLPDF